MSLEDPPTLAELPSAPTQLRQRSPMYQLTSPVSVSLGHILGRDRSTLIEVDDDAPWYERLVVRCARINRVWMRNIIITLVALLVLVLVAMPVRYLFGYSDVVPAFVATDLRELQSPRSPLAYTWLRGVADAQISEHVIDARRGTNSSQLVLVSATIGDNDLVVVPPVTCEQLLSKHAYANLIASAEKYLFKAGRSNCVCGPQLGADVAYIAFRGDGDARHSALEGMVVHMFNPVDDTADAYEALDADRLVQLRVGLQRVESSQNYRYNAARGNFTVLRRTVLSIVGVDSACQRNRVGLKAAMAADASECLDMLRGMDVRARARQQHKLGVSLNAEYFGHKTTDL